MKPKPTILLHGGAGALNRENVSKEKEQAYKDAIEHVLKRVYTELNNGMLAIDAVETAVRLLEDDALFNAGKGSVFCANGTHEMDAAIMDGKTGKSGAVALVSKIKNPIALARLVMDKSEHVFLAGAGAEAFALSHGIKLAEASYFYNEQRFAQWENLKQGNSSALDHNVDKKMGTVGAVALDVYGNVAAATSTGGMTNKLPGRIGDSPIIGAGTYANNKTCAVSCTGKGEIFMEALASYSISSLMELAQLPLIDAANEVVFNRLSNTNGSGGLIALDAQGTIAMPFNTNGMIRGYMNEKEVFTSVF